VYDGLRKQGLPSGTDWRIDYLGGQAGPAFQRQLLPTNRGAGTESANKELLKRRSSAAPAGPLYPELRAQLLCATNDETRGHGRAREQLRRARVSVQAEPDEVRHDEKSLSRNFAERALLFENSSPELMPDCPRTSDVAIHGGTAVNATSARLNVRPNFGSERSASVERFAHFTGVPETRDRLR